MTRSQVRVLPVVHIFEANLKFISFFFKDRAVKECIDTLLPDNDEVGGSSPPGRTMSWKN